MRHNIPVHAEVLCIDGEGGTSNALIVDPLQRCLTHIVVREQRLGRSERLVPGHLVDETWENIIWLDCTRDELHKLDDLIDAHVDVTCATPAVGPAYEWSDPLPLVVSERIPEGEFVLRRHSGVEATDGSVGHVHSLVVEVADRRITHVVVRTHHFLSRQEVAVPMINVERFYPDHVFLQLSRREVESLPHAALLEDYLLPALRAEDEELVPESPAEAGVSNTEVDASHLEGAHLLAEELGARLRAQGFTDARILEWAKAFLSSEHSGGEPEFLAWIRRREEGVPAREHLSQSSGAKERREPVRRAH